MAEGDGSEDLKPIPRSAADASSDKPTVGDKAKAELGQISSGLSVEDLRTQAEQAEHKRTQKFKDEFENIAVWALRILSLGLIVCGIVWLWHITAPECWRWLSPDRIDKLQDIVTGGLLAGLIVDHFRKRMN